MRTTYELLVEIEKLGFDWDEALRDVDAVLDERVGFENRVALKEEEISDELYNDILDGFKCELDEREEEEVIYTVCDNDDYAELIEIGEVYKFGDFYDDDGDIIELYFDDSIYVVDNFNHSAVIRFKRLEEFTESDLEGLGYCEINEKLLQAEVQVTEIECYDDGK